MLWNPKGRSTDDKFFLIAKIDCNHNGHGSMKLNLWTTKRRCSSVWARQACLAKVQDTAINQYRNLK